MSKIAVGDADSLIALSYRKDANHMKAKKVSEWLARNGFMVVYPNTAILEAITTFKRVLTLSNEAQLLNKQYLSGLFTVEYINGQIQFGASQRFSQFVSKKNTIFDAVVAETASWFGTEYIFSFDSLYPKLGFKLALE
ncbi:hypothetical protein HYU94_03570 [Candidatus Daviesbacteria bacterium]|nr:hypothetical protein [Candidatus Daviesbacteria bacterium]